MKDGCKTLKFLYQEGDAPGIGKDVLHGYSSSAALKLDPYFMPALVFQTEN